MVGEREVRSKAIRAMKAVTAGALLFAGVACSSGQPVENDANDEVDSENTGTENDESLEVVDARTCNTDEPTGICPEGCSIDEDIDCCEREDLCSWAGGACSCAIPGPFVPPSMPV